LEGPPKCQFAGLTEAIESAKPFDLILIYPGNYQETLAISQSLRLVALEQGEVRVQGAQTGVPTLTVQVTDQMHLTLEGITLLAPEDDDPAGVCQDFQTSLCSWGIDLRGEGSLSLFLANVEITQQNNRNSTGLACTDLKGFARVTMIKSRISAHRIGINWVCRSATSELHIQDTIVSGNWYQGLNVFSHMRTSISLDSSSFVGNGGAIVAYGEDVDLAVYRSEFQGNGIGVIGNLFKNGVLQVVNSVIVDSRMRGVMFGWDNEFSENVRYVLDAAYVARNQEEGILVSTSGQVEITNSLIEENGHGIRILLATGQLWIRRDRIVQNAGWGIALDVPECFPESLRPQGISPEFRITGEGNIIADNRLGSLCPVSFPWPPQFRHP
jgi:hypothetical protein